MSTRIHKGGESRYVLANAVVNDYFMLPAGYRIRNMISENAILPYNLQNVQSLAVTTTATAAGTITIDGTALSVAIANGDTAAVVAAKMTSSFPITGATSGVGWSAFNTGTTIYIYGVNTKKIASSAVSVSMGTVTGTTVTPTAIVSGTNGLGGTPNFTFGNTPGVVPVQTFTVTAAATSAGTIIVDGVNIYLPGASTTTAGIASAIAASNLWGGTTTNWTAAVSATNSSTVILTGVVPKNAVAAVTVTTGTAASVTFGTVTATVAGVLDTSLFSSAQAIPTAGQTVSDVSAGLASNKTWQPWTSPDKSVVTFTVSSATAGTIIVAGQSVTLTTANVATATALATAIAAFPLFPGYYITNPSAGVINIWGTPNRVGTPFPVVSLGTATGITWTTVNTAHDLNYYIGFGATTAALTPLIIGNSNEYVLLEKLF